VPEWFITPGKGEINTMTTTMRSRRTFGAAVLFVVLMASLECANAQSEQALGLKLLQTSIQTQLDVLSLTDAGFSPAFLPATETCPINAKNGCTLRIDVSCELETADTLNVEIFNVTVTGASLPPVDPAAEVQVTVAAGNPFWDTRSFHWMQRSVPAGATVTVGIGVAAESIGGVYGGAVSYRTETIELFKN
jgi:hypothetical protein